MKPISRYLPVFAVAVSLLTGGNTGPVSASPASALITTASSRPLLHGGSKGHAVEAAQRRYQKLGYSLPVTGYYGSMTRGVVKNWQKRNHLRVTGVIRVNGGEWRLLGRQSRKAAHDSARLDPRCRTKGLVLCVDKSRRELDYVENGAIRVRFPVRTGLETKERHTREGVFKIEWRDPDHKSKEYGGSPMPYSMFFSKGQAFHFSAKFAKYGYGTKRHPLGSHGCINLGTKHGLRSAEWLYNHTPDGTKVVVTK